MGGSSSSPRTRPHTQCPRCGGPRSSRWSSSSLSSRNLRPPRRRRKAERREEKERRAKESGQRLASTASLPCTQNPARRTVHVGGTCPSLNVAAARRGPHSAATPNTNTATSRPDLAAPGSERTSILYLREAILAIGTTAIAAVLGVQKEDTSAR